MSGSDWPAMRSSVAQRGLLVAALFVAAAGVFAAEPATDKAANEQNEASLPEHRARPLPTDTFKPSEEISEDFPVPFPVDI